MWGREFFKKSTKNTDNRTILRVLKTTCVLTKFGEAAKQPEKVRALYITPREFLLRREGALDGVCPGCPGVAS